MVTDEGELYTWGKNKLGQLGIMDHEKKKPVGNQDEPKLVDYF